MSALLITAFASIKLAGRHVKQLLHLVCGINLMILLAGSRHLGQEGAGSS